MAFVLDEYWKKKLEDLSWYIGLKSMNCHGADCVIFCDTWGCPTITSDATIDDKVGIMPTLDFQWLSISEMISCVLLGHGWVITSLSILWDAIIYPWPGYLPIAAELRMWTCLVPVMSSHLPQTLAHSEMIRYEVDICYCSTLFNRMPKICTWNYFFDYFVIIIVCIRNMKLEQLIWNRFINVFDFDQLHYRLPFLVNHSYI